MTKPKNAPLIDLISTSEHTFDKRDLKVGDRFQASFAHAHILRALGRAVDVDPSETLEEYAEIDLENDDESLAPSGDSGKLMESFSRKRGTYDRRDMVAITEDERMEDDARIPLTTLGPDGKPVRRKRKINRRDMKADTKAGK